MPPSSHDLTLEIAAADLVKRLGGRWRPQGAMCLCPAHSDTSPSLSVRVGDRSLLFKCFAGCDTVDVLRAIRFLKLDIPTVATCDSPAPDPGDARMAERARELWTLGRPLAGTPGADYLQNRCIETLPAALRWSPRTPLGPGRDVRFRPAILAAVQERQTVIAIQRLFIDPDRAWLAGDLYRPKLSLGRPLGGAVQLRPAGRRLGLAEGIESAESAAILLGFPVWAALGSERLHQLWIPDVVRELVLLPDNDAPGRRAARLARDVYAGRSFSVETIWPAWGLNDWNDVLRRGGEEVGRRVRIAA